MQRIRAFLLVEVVAFAGAGLVHFGLLVHGYEHRQARVAESVITLVLLVGLVLSWLRPTWTREAGLVAQGFALLGTLVGSFTIAQMTHDLRRLRLHGLSPDCQAPTPT